MSKLRVAELFAGVGGFRIGLEAANEALGRTAFEVNWSNQWEPGTKAQHASNVYLRAFGPEGHTNVDISTVSPEQMPEVDLVVGGFPCQDYSVATTLQRSGGLAGKKGVLWWEIHRLLRDKQPRPRYVFLENVDRLLKSPVAQRGRDFAVMLASLADLGYSVEWRVINAAEYGMPQRRRRVFILAYLAGTTIAEEAKACDSTTWITSAGVFAEAFQATSGQFAAAPVDVAGDLVALSDSFNQGRSASPFLRAGLMIGRTVYTMQVEPQHDGQGTTLGDTVVSEDLVPSEYFISDPEPWAFLKGPKALPRVHRTNGHQYLYSEGGIAFPDPLDKPSRTIITGEGGPTPSRFKHVISTPSGRLRRLLPVELERLNMFPDDHTAGVPAGRRAFLMGNALVTGVVKRLGVTLAERDVMKGQTTESA